MKALIRRIAGGGDRPLGRQLSIALTVIFSLSLLVAVLLLNLLLTAQARHLVDQRSNLVMDTMLAVRDYTTGRITPIVAPLNEGAGEFRPEAVPSYSATSVFANLRGKDTYRNYSYREAALNPTNLKDKADGFETALIERFRSDPEAGVLSGERATSIGRLHYVAKPIKVGQESCLVCHSTPDRAPRSQLLAYGESNGFGWQLDEIVGAQIVTVPQQAIFDAKNQSLAVTVGLLVLIFVAVGLVANAVLDALILRPMRAISRRADEASVTPASVTFHEKERHDEIGLLARSFERMKQSLAISMQMLKERQKP